MPLGDFGALNKAQYKLIQTVRAIAIKAMLANCTDMAIWKYQQNRELPSQIRNTLVLETPVQEIE